MYKVFFVTFGCKVNQYETECLRSCFVEKGFVSAENESEADVFVVNSCTVTGSGDSKSLYAVRRLRRSYPRAVIALTGCLPQAAPETAEKCPEADVVTGTKEREKLVGLVMNALESGECCTEIVPYGKSDSFEDIPCPVGFSESGRTRAFMKIQDGCNQFCSYCIIPYARGRCRSKSLDSLRTEAQRLAQSGHRELVLVGINLAFYGQEYGLRLVDAVETCCAVEGIERVRLGSLEPEMISDDDLERLSRLPEFCPQFHLSLQSGSDGVLRRMNRKYNTDDYFALVCRIRSRFPDAAFTTDIMVGFPQETEEEFAESMAFAEKVGFAKIHVFQYSPRKGTVAARLPQLHKRVKAERAGRMKTLGDALQEKYLKSLVGKTVPVLFERENESDFYHGYAPDYTLIKIFRKKCEKSLRNMIFCVTIEVSGHDCCYGSICDSP